MYAVIKLTSFGVDTYEHPVGFYLFPYRARSVASRLNKHSSEILSGQGHREFYVKTYFLRI